MDWHWRWHCYTPTYLALGGWKEEAKRDRTARIRTLTRYAAHDAVHRTGCTLQSTTSMSSFNALHPMPPTCIQRRCPFTIHDHPRSRDPFPPPLTRSTPHPPPSTHHTHTPRTHTTTTIQTREGRSSRSLFLSLSVSLSLSLFSSLSTRLELELERKTRKTETHRRVDGKADWEGFHRILES